jgi:hypothetical protein
MATCGLFGLLLYQRALEATHLQRPSKQRGALLAVSTLTRIIIGWLKKRYFSHLQKYGSRAVLAVHTAGLNLLVGSCLAVLPFLAADV